MKEGARRTSKCVLKNMIRAIRHTRIGELDKSTGINLNYAPMVLCALKSKDTELQLEGIVALLLEANVDPGLFAANFKSCEGCSKQALTIS